VALVPQQLADLRQCRAGPKKLGGEAVSEKMGALVRLAADAPTLESGLGDHRNRATGCKADVGRQRAEKQSATPRPRATITQANAPRT
jgi:hypothetical protein